MRLVIRSPAVLVLAFTLSGCAAASEADLVSVGQGAPALPAAPDAGPVFVPKPLGPIAAEPACEDAPVTDLTLREVALYQGVKVTLAQGGEAIAPSAPIVAGRDALLRAFVEPRPGWTARELVLRVRIGEGAPIEERALVSVPSRDEALASTLNVEIPGARITPDVELAVSIHESEPDCDRARAALGEPARFPASGAYALPAESSGGPFRVVLVPVRYGADGSGRLPDTSPENVRTFRDHLRALFPVQGVEVRVRSSPLDWSVPVDRGGAGWSALLNECLNLRHREQPQDDTYYYCLFAPAPTMREYCGRGCVAGLGPVPSLREAFYRASIGVGYRGSEGTFVHEVGHTLGRPHAPCGDVANPDPEYPYAGGSIGSWGWDFRTGELKSPARYTDVLGYCRDTWISDYNYARIFERIRGVRGVAALVSGEPTRYATIVVEVDGSLHWGSEVELETPPSGERVPATLETASGVRASADAVFVAVSHVSGGIVYVPLPDHDVDRIELSGLGTIEAP